jgi:hypothetical protein
MDLARAILFELNKDEYRFTGSWHNISIAGHTDEDVSFHVRLLKEAGLLDAACIRLNTGEVWKPIAITWDGFEFLEAARSDTHWEKAKSAVREKGLALTLETVKLALSEGIRKAFGH